MQKFIQILTIGVTIFLFYKMFKGRGCCGGNHKGNGQDGGGGCCSNKGHGV